MKRIYTFIFFIILLNINSFSNDYKILLLDISGGNIKKEKAKEITNNLAKKIIDTNKFDIMTKNEVERLDIKNDKISDDNYCIQLGEKINANIVISIIIDPNNKYKIIRTNILSIKNKMTLFSFDLKYNNLENIDIDYIFQKVVNNLSFKQSYISKRSLYYIMQTKVYDNSLTVISIY